MNPNPEFQEAINCEVVWKSVEMQTFASSLISHALALDPRQPLSGLAPSEFTTDIVPDSDRQPISPNAIRGQGIAGGVIELLKSAGLIEWQGHHSGGQFYGKRIKSNRKDRHGASLCVYKLASHALARAFLKRHGIKVQANQFELSLLPSSGGHGATIGKPAEANVSNGGRNAVTMP